MADFSSSRYIHKKGNLITWDTQKTYQMAGAITGADCTEIRKCITVLDGFSQEPGAPELSGALVELWDAFRRRRDHESQYPWPNNRKLRIRFSDLELKALADLAASADNNVSVESIFYPLNNKEYLDLLKDINALHIIGEFERTKHLSSNIADEVPKNTVTNDGHCREFVVPTDVISI